MGAFAEALLGGGGSTSSGGGMRPDIEIDKASFRHIERALERLTKAEADKVVLAALKKAAKPIRNKAKLNALSMVGTHARVRTIKRGKNKGTTKLLGGEAQRLSGTFAGKLRKSIVTRAQKKSSRAIGEMGVNVIIDKKYNKDFVDVSKGGTRNYIPAAIEFGHNLVFFGNPTGRRVAPIPFMRNAYDTQKQAARGIAIQEMLKGLSKLAAKSG